MKHNGFQLARFIRSSRSDGANNAGPVSAAWKPGVIASTRGDAAIFSRVRAVANRGNPNSISAKAITGSAGLQVCTRRAYRRNVLREWPHAFRQCAHTQPPLDVHTSAGRNRLNESQSREIARAALDERHNGTKEGTERLTQRDSCVERFATLRAIILRLLCTGDARACRGVTIENERELKSKDALYCRCARDRIRSAFARPVCNATFIALGTSRPSTETLLVRTVQSTSVNLNFDSRAFVHERCT